MVVRPFRAMLVGSRSESNDFAPFFSRIPEGCTTHFTIHGCYGINVPFMMLYTYVYMMISQHKDHY